ncbi:MAG TPA: DUF5666 domain-containing protein [Acidobacteriaceae bacterium]|jgi:hypothetical protein|nr:DUF5666 domain-containing protein [Acidobacteriaceae bacterium]
MTTHAVARFTRCASPIVLAVLLAAGCGDHSTPPTANQNVSTAPAFVIGTDAPVAGVVSFSAQIQSIDAIDASGNSVSLLSGTPTVDFARYNGLQTLLDMNDVPAGTYTQIAVTFGSATIGYLQTGSGTEPTIQTMPAIFDSSSITTTLANPLVVAQTGPVGIHLDFRLDKSIEVDSSGQITGHVNPTLDIRAVGPADSGAYIDEFIAGVVSVDSSGQSFVIQGPHGRNFTVNVNAQTEWDNGDTISDLTTTSIVQISGIIDHADSTLDADEVAILSQNGFYASGQITYVQPPSGVATNFDLYVRGTLPASGDSVSLGQITQVALTGSEKYFIYWMHNRFTQFLFNSSSLLPGQHVSVGGPLSGAATQPISVKRVVLRNWGFNGAVAANTNAATAGSFQMNVTGFAGQLVPGTVTVYTAGGTQWRDGYSSDGDITVGDKIRVVGILLKDPTSGNPVILGRYVDDMNQ